MTIEDIVVLKYSRNGRPESWIVKNKRMIEMWERYLLAIDEILELKERKNKWTGVVLHEIYERFKQHPSVVFRNLVLMCVNKKRPLIIIRQYGRAVVITLTEEGKKVVEHLKHSM